MRMCLKKMKLKNTLKKTGKETPVIPSGTSPSDHDK